MVFTGYLKGRMGKIEGGEERFFKIKFSPIHKIYITYTHINFIII